MDEGLLLLLPLLEPDARGTPPVDGIAAAEVERLVPIIEADFHESSS